MFLPLACALALVVTPASGWTPSSSESVLTLTAPDVAPGDLAVLQIFPAERAASPREFVAAGWAAFVRQYAEPEASPIQEAKNPAGLAVAMAAGSVADGAGGFFYVVLAAVGDGGRVLPVLYVAGSNETYRQHAETATATLNAIAAVPANVETRRTFATRRFVFARVAARGQEPAGGGLDRAIDRAIERLDHGRRTTWNVEPLDPARPPLAASIVGGVWEWSEGGVAKVLESTAASGALLGRLDERGEGERFRFGPRGDYTRVYLLDVTTGVCRSKGAEIEKGTYRFDGLTLSLRPTGTSVDASVCGKPPKHEALARPARAYQVGLDGEGRLVLVGPECILDRESCTTPARRELVRPTP